jgi:hypothetical protein
VTDVVLQLLLVLATSANSVLIVSDLSLEYRVVFTDIQSIVDYCDDCFE